jgi:hypothetical protein
MACAQRYIRRQLAPKPALHFFFPALLFICMMRNGGTKTKEREHIILPGMDEA